MSTADDSQLKIVEYSIISADRGGFDTVGSEDRGLGCKSVTDEPQVGSAAIRGSRPLRVLDRPQMDEWKPACAGGMRDHIHRIRPSAAERRPSPGRSRHRESFDKRGMRSWPVSARPVEGACCDTTAFAAIDRRPPASCPGQTRGPHVGSLAWPNEHCRLSDLREGLIRLDDGRDFSGSYSVHRQARQRQLHYDGRRADDELTSYCSAKMERRQRAQKPKRPIAPWIVSSQATDIARFPSTTAC